MRIALIHIGQETNDFNPLPTTLRDFHSFGIFEGDVILEKLSELGQVGGHVVAAKAVSYTHLTLPTKRIV